ncbi:MAG: hypothetical protein AB1Z98_18835 [Nannocystaceae bacterium]
MKKNNAMKWGAAAAVLLGVGVVAAGSAQAGEEDDAAGKGLQDSGVRHGIRYKGCEHFELVDPDAVEAWGRSNAWRFAKWAVRLDEVRADPEPAIVEAMQALFPECSWPPGDGVTFGPERIGWREAMALAKAGVQDMDFAFPDATAAAAGITGLTLRRVLTARRRVRPMGVRRW